MLLQVTALKIKHNPFAKAFLDAKERPDGFYQRDFIPNYPQPQQPQYTQCESLTMHQYYKKCFILMCGMIVHSVRQGTEWLQSGPWQVCDNFSLHHHAQNEYRPLSLHMILSPLFSHVYGFISVSWGASMSYLWP